MNNDEGVERIWTGDVGGDAWVTDLCWSDWEPIDTTTCEMRPLGMRTRCIAEFSSLGLLLGQAKLAFVAPGKGVQMIRVTRCYQNDGHLDLQTGKVERMVPADKRAIKGMKWVHVSQS